MLCLERRDPQGRAPETLSITNCKIEVLDPPEDECLEEDLPAVSGVAISGSTHAILTNCTVFGATQDGFIRHDEHALVSNAGQLHRSGLQGVRLPCTRVKLSWPTSLRGARVHDRVAGGHRRDDDNGKPVRGPSHL